MEIITLPLKGTVEHTDSIRNKQQISAGELQVMSAGSGIQHSEYNPHSDKELELFQIWVFPRQRNLKPRYEKTNIRDLEKRNELYTIVSPIPGSSGNWINQDAWFHLGKYDSGAKLEYTTQKNGNGIYLFVIEGKIRIEDQILNKRDALGIWDSEAFSTENTEDSYFLIIDLPMHS